MPIWDYYCSECQWKGERIATHSNKDNQRCEQEISFTSVSVLGVRREKRICDEPLYREEIALTGEPNTKGTFQPKAILGNGQRVAGHFGAKEAKVKSKNPTISFGKI